MNNERTCILKFIPMILLVITFLAATLSGCNRSEHYTANDKPPDNVRESFYLKSIEVLNFYVSKLKAKSSLTDQDNDYLLGYYRSTPSESSEEVMIKASLTYLDLVYREIDHSLKEDNQIEVELKTQEFHERLEEALKLLELDKE